MSHIPFQNGNKRLSGPKIIKKYGNRKLYDTQQSSYVVLKDIEKMIRNKEDIQVIDNETQDDITVSTLTQIIFSSEKKSKVSPPVNVLKSIIREGDGSFSSFLAKLGLFAESERAGSNDSLSDILSSEKKNLIKEDQSIEQKIASLMNAGDGVSSTDDSVPELPGHRPLS
ncbi:MAG: polyhydroxyalkanoate synthesis regulator DNA-binding domain-containing protein [Oligoflexia bacterium]|nr:polyhydroxyalkanoate synthesis regulator DNA-binding domain-containing protein [Oligoflexia bacterium]